VKEKGLAHFLGFRVIDRPDGEAWFCGEISRRVEMVAWRRLGFFASCTTTPISPFSRAWPVPTIAVSFQVTAFHSMNRSQRWLPLRHWWDWSSRPHSWPPWPSGFATGHVWYHLENEHTLLCLKHPIMINEALLAEPTW